MFSISISHKTAPVPIRELFAFTKEEQELFLLDVIKEKEISGCVIVSTCNRSEVYFDGRKVSVSIMEKKLAAFKGVEPEKMLRHYRIYSGEKAIHHLYDVVCGMDSMVLGEDEILGQMKEAYLSALHLGTTDYHLNRLFQDAIACAKRIKTDTKLSKIPISVATLTAHEILQFQPEIPKKVLMIGLTSKMGTTIAKNIKGKPGIELIGTIRNHHARDDLSVCYEEVTLVDYHDRYRYVEEADIIISSTISPHYTITYDEFKQNLTKNKKRLLVDLSVPRDIDEQVKQVQGVQLFDIDYFECLSKNNHGVKLQEIEEAKLIIGEHVEEITKDLEFHEFLQDLPEVKKIFEEKSFDSILYALKKNADSSELSVLLGALKKLKR